MKSTIVFVALIGLCAAYIDLSKITESAFLRALETFQYPYSSPDPCLNTTLSSCQAIFNRNLNITSNADWNDPQEFIRQLLRILESGISTGLLPVCNAWQQLYSCLGTTYYSCFNPVYLISQGHSLRRSFQFTAEILRTQFKCVGGFEQSIKQYPCIMGALQNTAAQNACFEPFNQTLHGNYDQICQATQNLTNCFENIFSNCGADAQWWACEDVRVGFALFNCPNHRCNVPTANVFSMDDQEEKEHHAMTEEDLTLALEGVAYRYMTARQNIPRDIPGNSAE